MDVVRTWAIDEARFAAALAAVDPSFGSVAFELAGGHVALCGPGTFVNIAAAVGVDARMTAADFERLEASGRTVGVRPAIEISPATDPSVRAAALERCYEPGPARSALRRELSDVEQLPPPNPRFAMESGADQLATWCETSAIGWGHDTPDRRRANEAFAHTSAHLDRNRLLLARDAGSGRPIGCASITVNGPIATLGGMSTVPSERRRGLQGEMIRHRLRLAAGTDGCRLATTTAAPGSDSERNLLRHGFESWFTIETLLAPAFDTAR